MSQLQNIAGGNNKDIEALNIGGDS